MQQIWRFGFLRPGPHAGLAGLRRLALLIALAGMAGCAGVPARSAAPVSQSFDDAGATGLGRIAAASLAPGPGQDVTRETGRISDRAALSGFRLLPEAAFALDARLALARRAEKSLDVQYYLIRDDAVGRQVLRELRHAAARGVRVRLLVDDLYTAGEDELFAALAAVPNVEVRLFNPLPSRAGSIGTRLLFSLHEFGRINHRMHNKLFIADASFAVTGGRNIADDYFMRSPSANFIDLDVMAAGPVVRELGSVFDRYWNSAHSYPVDEVVGSCRQRPEPAAPRDFDALLGPAGGDEPLRERDILGHTPVSRQLDEGPLDQFLAPARVLADSPDKIDRRGAAARGAADTVTEHVLALFAAAHEEVLITSPYFIPGERGVEMMREATRQGGRVVLLTNSLGATDEPFVYWRYARYREDMLDAGVTIYELGPLLAGRSGQLGDFGRSVGRLHAKAALIDGRTLFIGSMNLDGRSARLNTEMGLVIDSPELTAEAHRLLNNDRFESAYRLRLKAGGHGVDWVEHTVEGAEIVHPDEPDTNWPLRLKNWFLSPFVMEELL